MWIVSSLFANLCVMYLEYTFRTLSPIGASWQYLKIALIVAAMQWTWWLTLHYGPGLMTTWAVFTLGNSLLRVISAYWLVKEPPSLMILGGVVTMFLGALLIKEG